MKIDGLLQLLIDQKGSDLFLSVGIEPCLKVNGKMTPLGSVRLDAEPEEMLEMLTKYNLIAIPVLNNDERMEGIVTVDDVLAHYLPRIVKGKRR